MSDIRIFVSTEHSDPISRIIDAETDNLWSHTGWLWLSSGYTYSAMLDGGVQKRPPNPKARVLVLTCDGMDASLAWALTQEGCKYDWMDILGIAFRQNLETSGRFICDKLLFRAQQEIKLPLLNHTFIPMMHLTPRDVLVSPYVNEDRDATGDLIKRGLAADWSWQ